MLKNVLTNVKVFDTMTPTNVMTNVKTHFISANQSSSKHTATGRFLYLSYNNPQNTPDTEQHHAIATRGFLPPWF
jgi:hypothetical protein